MRNVVMSALMMFVAYGCVEHQPQVSSFSTMKVFEGMMNGCYIHLSENVDSEARRYLIIGALDDPDTSLVAVDSNGDWKWDNIYWYGVCEYNMTRTWTIALIDYERNQIRFIPDSECPDQPPLTLDQVRDTFVLMANAILSVYNEAHTTQELRFNDQGVAQ